MRAALHDAALVQHYDLVRVNNCRQAVGDDQRCSIGGNAVKVLRALEIWPALEEVVVRPEAVRFRLFETGETLHELRLGETYAERYGAPHCQVHRADLHHVLAKALLGVAPDADKNEIRRAYYKKARSCHPDKFPGDSFEIIASFGRRRQQSLNVTVPDGVSPGEMIALRPPEKQQRFPEQRRLQMQGQANPPNFIGAMRLAVNPDEDDPELDPRQFERLPPAD